MTLSESISTCLSKYFTVKGRATKSEFWWFQLLWMVCFGLNYFINLEPLNYFLLGIMIIILIPLFTVGVRRLHDTNKSGLHYLWSLIPFIGSFIVLGSDDCRWNKRKK
jgi:uncharacterized membrane protein YhaH (DUF805 family)